MPFSRLGTVLLAIALVLVAMPCHAQRTARPYAVHEYRLGATLSDVRAIRHPVARSDGEQKLVCSNDDSAGADKLRPSPDLVEAGAIKCGFLTFFAGDEPVIATLDLFAERVECELLFYRRMADKDYRLAQITLGFANRRFQNVVAIFRRAYGQPISFDVDGISTVFGADLPNLTYYWDNVASSIRLDQFSVSLERMSVIFVHNELWDELGAKLRRISRPR